MSHTANEDSPRQRKKILLPALLALLAVGVLAGGWKYYSFYYHTTRQESSGAVKRGSFEATLRGKPVKLLIYQQEKPASQELVFFTSGDGGWSPFCADIAAHLAEKGKTVVALDVKNYLTTFHSPEKPATFEELTKDYEELINAALQRPGVDAQKPFTLAGWSVGAGYSILIGSREQMKPRVGRVLAVSLPVYNQLAWKTSDAIIYVTKGVPDEKTFDAHDIIGQLAPVPLYIYNASADDTAPLKDAQSLFAQAGEPKQLIIATARGHHFEGGEAEFYQKLDESFLRR
jgi:dienelactone hydrolase